MIPKNTSSSNFTDTFSSLFSVLGLCSLLKVAGFRNIQNMLDMILLGCSNILIPLPNRGGKGLKVA